MSKVGKIPTHDVSRKDAASMNSMEFNETLTICSSLLAKSIVKVSSDDITFGFQDTTRGAWRAPSKHGGASPPTTAAVASFVGRRPACFNALGLQRSEHECGSNMVMGT